MSPRSARGTEPFKGLCPLFLAALLGVATPVQANPLAGTEALFLEYLDAANALDYVNSGRVAAYEGADAATWRRRMLEAHAKLTASIAALDEPKLPPAEQAALAAIRTTLGDYGDPTAVTNTADALDCRDAAREDLDYDRFTEVLSACYREIGNHLKFEDGTVDRGSALGLLAEIEEPERRKALFDAFRPLWSALNGANEPGSPYRRMIALAAEDGKAHGSYVDAAAKAIGATVEDVERWLVRILEAWRDANPATPVEPWDYRYAMGEAHRALAAAFAQTPMIPANERFYADLGADLSELSIVYDIKDRPDKSPFAYCDFLRRGRYVDGRWQPTIAFVVGRYEGGDLASLNELVHEAGHAVHISAIRNRPAFTDWPDTLFVEAFADVPSWSVFEPAWQRRYLGSAIPVGTSLRALYGTAMLDVAWSLFELRMLREPATDPNALWTQITHDYLRIRPHPELSWWAQRVQLGGSPGYMIHYGLGAVLTAEIRAKTAEAIGDFDAGNPKWYAWSSGQLLRYGSERSAQRLMDDLLGRPLSPEPLLTQIRRIKGL